MTTEALTPCEDRPGRTGDTAHDLDAGIPLPPPPKLDSVNAAHSTAVRALDLDLWPLAVHPGDKRPMGNGWGSERSTAKKLERVYHETPTAGVGLCLGPGRGPAGSWLVDLEIDGPKGSASLSAFLGAELVDTLGWSSNRGPHRLFSVDGARLRNGLAAAGAREGKGHDSGVYHLDALPDLEIRVGGYKPDGTTVKQIQSVCPPTPGTDGTPREWNGCWTVSELSEAAYAFVERIAAERSRPNLNGHATAGRAGRHSPNGTTCAKKYARGALKKAAAAVAAAVNGTRHDVLRNESLAMAGFVKAGVLSEEVYRAELMAADQANRHSDDDPGDAQKLLESALQMAEPRDLSFLDHKAKTGGNGNHKARRGKRALDRYEPKIALVPSAPPPGSVPASLACDAWYTVSQGHLQYARRGTQGGTSEDLANFDARILEHITRHDGTEELIRYKIRATHAKGHQREVVVDAGKFAALMWAYDLGPEFAIGTGRDIKEKVRHAIQLLSAQEGIVRRVEHTSLGWILHEGQWLYLHAGGAIGAEGATDSVQVDLPEALSKYKLPPTPIEQVVISQAVEAHHSTWELAKADRPGGCAVAAILATLPFRAVLSAFDAAIHFGGPSGNCKTSVARLAYQYFSTIAQGRNFPMPAGWSDTPNALQRLGYDCRDSLLIVDDLKNDKQVWTAEVILQAQGNLQNRARMNKDQSLQKPLNPRGTLLSNGEIDPRTRSALGRMLMLEIRAGDIDLGVLTRLQALGDQGWFALAMAAYIQWLAPQLESVRQDHARLAASIRQEIGVIPGAHPRHADIVAQLVAAYQLFQRFAVERGGIEELTAEGYVATARKHLIELGHAQRELQDESKPGRRFLDLIASALQAKRCHLLNARSDEAPSNYAGACGWQKDYVFQGKENGSNLDWKVPNSKCIGFIDEVDKLVYLNPVESVAMATEMARRNGDLQSFARVGRELSNEGLCQSSTEREKDRHTRAKRIAGHGQKRYIWIPIAELFEEPEA